MYVCMCAYLSGAVMKWCDWFRPFCLKYVFLLKPLKKNCTFFKYLLSSPSFSFELLSCFALFCSALFCFVLISLPSTNRCMIEILHSYFYLHRFALDYFATFVLPPGLTRARKRVIITYRKSYYNMVLGKVIHPVPSRFLSHFPDYVRLSEYVPVLSMKPPKKFNPRTKKKKPSKE